MTVSLRPALLALLALPVGGAGLLGAGCTGSSETGGGAVDAAPKPTAPAEIPEIGTVSHQWDNSVGDKSVPAELGGPGFTGEGWITRQNISQVANPDAPQGGTMVKAEQDWPATLRVMGENYNTQFNYEVIPLLYDTLLQPDYVTLDYAPRLATHWWISEDRQTYRFRINPAARWSDGEEITSEDVIATFDLLMDPTLRDPAAILTYGKLERPVAKSKYIVEVTAKEDNWRNFLYFAGSLQVLPAHQIGDIKGSDYLDRYQFAYTAVSGPYEVKPENIEMGTSVTVTRRADWWGEPNPAWDGWYNIGTLKYVVVKDQQLAFEKVKKHEIDYFWIQKAQWWAEDVPTLDAVQRGLLVPRKFYTDTPIGTSGIALNTQRAPLDDVKVRKALQHLYDRETMIEKLFYGEYEPLTSYFQGGIYANPDNVRFEYDEVTAVELLEAAGWTEKNAEGYRVKGGQELALTLSYRSQLGERYLTVFQEACKRAGIRLEMQLLTPASHWKNVQGKDFQIAEMAWGGLLFPNPETTWHSRLAEQESNNNITGFADPEVDKLLTAYDREYDVQKRIELVRQIDGLLYEQSHYVLGWYGPSQRVVYWNKFGMPEWGTHRFGEYSGDYFLGHIWWVDPEKERKLQAAEKDPTAKLARVEPEVRYWPAWNERKKTGGLKPSVSPDGGLAPGAAPETPAAPAAPAAAPEAPATAPDAPAEPAGAAQP
jgi:microcin C transport system substrate-binding protein